MLLLPDLFPFVAGTRRIKFLQYQFVAICCGMDGFIFLSIYRLIFKERA